MRTAIQVLAGGLLGIWLLVAMTSPMMLGAPGASNRLSNLVTIIAVLSYPLVIGLVFYLLGWNLAWFSPRGLLLTTLAAPIVALFFYGRPTLNLLRGIANEGYSVKADAVYASGKKIAGADPQTFQALSNYYAKDAVRVYRYIGLGEIKIVENADPVSFEIVTQPIGQNELQFDARDKHRRYLAGKPLP